MAHGNTCIHNIESRGYRHRYLGPYGACGGIVHTAYPGQRTVGAALSDLCYCLVTAFGLSLIEGFLTAHQDVIQLLGSLVLVGFGIYLFRKNPAQNLRRNSQSTATPKADIITGFLFTVSNPLIIFLIIGLFARFNFLDSYMQVYHHVSGFLFIIVGALLWWWCITWIINKIRSHFNLRSMWLINRITGSLIFIFAAVGIFTSLHSMLDWP